MRPVHARGCALPSGCRGRAGAGPFSVADCACARHLAALGPLVPRSRRAWPWPTAWSTSPASRSTCAHDGWQSSFLVMEYTQTTGATVLHAMAPAVDRIKARRVSTATSTATAARSPATGWSCGQSGSAWPAAGPAAGSRWTVHPLPLKPTGVELVVVDDENAFVQLDVLAPGLCVDRDNITIKPRKGWRGSGDQRLDSRRRPPRLNPRHHELQSRRPTVARREMRRETEPDSSFSPQRAERRAQRRRTIRRALRFASSNWHISRPRASPVEALIAPVRSTIAPVRSTIIPARVWSRSNLALRWISSSCSRSPRSRTKPARSPPCGARNHGSTLSILPSCWAARGTGWTRPAPSHDRSGRR